MRREALGGTALIAGAILGLVTMALHPTGGDVMRDARGQGALALAVHTLALTAVPVTSYGALVLTRRLAPAGGLAELALAFYAMSALATLMAATASGLLAPGLIARLLTLDGDARVVAGEVLHYNSSVNQAFARVLVAASSVAIGLWSAEILRTGRMRRGTGIFGCVVAVLTLAILLSGHLRLDVHGFGAVVLAQAAWLVAVGVELRRSNE
jgi:hypothetical protein